MDSNFPAERGDRIINPLSMIVVEKMSSGTRLDITHVLKEPKFPKEKYKTLLAFIIMAFCLVINTITLSVVHEKVPDMKKVRPLPDIVLDSFHGNYPWAMKVCDMIVVMSTNAGILLMIFHKHRYIIFRRVFLVVSLLYLMRALTIIVTVLPVADPNTKCVPKANHTNFMMLASRVIKQISSFGMVTTRYIYCGDYIYSGHTVMLVLSYLVIKEYSPRRLVYLHWMSALASILGVFFLFVARGHYTIDVLVAYYATTRIFWIYHTLANYEELKTRSRENHLSRLWWFRIFIFFEGNVKGAVPRTFDCPFTCPDCLQCIEL